MSGRHTALALTPCRNCPFSDPSRTSRYLSATEGIPRFSEWQQRGLLGLLVDQW
jgi:hypothetical protein